MSLAEQSVTDSTGAKPALPWGVRALANELPDSQGARSLKRLAALLEQGHGWQKALADPTLRIPEHVRGLLQASLHSPDVAGTLERFVHLNRRSVQLRREMWLSVAYPLAVIVALGVLFCCFEFFVVAELGRMYENLFQDFGMTQPLVLPAMTRVMIAWSGPPALVLLATLLILGVLLPVVWSLWRPLWLDVLAHRLPVLGCIWLWAGLADLCRLLALMLERGIPLPDALQLASGGLISSELAHASRNLARQVAAGLPLADAIAVTPPMPDTLAPIVQWGETRSSLPEALEAAAEMYEGRVRLQLNFVRLFLPPCVFIFAGGVIVLSLIAVFLPMFRLLQSLV